MARNRFMFKALLTSALVSAAVAAPAPTQHQDDTKPADYIIIGGGPAGLVIAEHLSQNPDINVVLLEAGPDESSNPDITTPGNFFFTAPFQWPYASQPDPNLNDRAPGLTQGKILGGGTAVHAMLYCHGSASVFDEWADVSGNEGLRWDSLLDSFRATTHYTDEARIDYEQVVDPTSFGEGPLEITRQRELFDFDKPFANKMASEFGIPEIDNVSGQGIGVTQGFESITAANRTRSYAYNSFGFLANSRPNFDLRQEAWVSQIVFEDRVANSVVYNDTASGEMQTIHGKEIIVTAGAINSPQLLMLSGVGPADHLESLGIPVVADIPEVGENLMDHHLAIMEFETVPGQDTLWQWQNNETYIAINQALYDKDGSGILGTNFGDVSGSVRLPDSVFEGKGDYFPNLPADRPHMTYEYTNLAAVPGSPNVTILSAWAAVVQPEARGNVRLPSADYRDHPLIFSNYWGTEAERAAVLYGYKQLRSLMNSEDLKPWLPREIFPGPDVTSDEEVWQAIQQSSDSWHHPVGTTSLGTVLDANWRVRGLKGLRVVGTSSMPQIPTCPIQGAAYAIGHRAALDIAAEDRV